LTDRH